ncbi:MAG: hypothetical protein HN732_23500 [Rhodospirillaceae bacterium]|nr:hypothetical protein [Rhodospirillaceae bacterium]MBT7760317.1 hypothetical protein [Rhodospirillaceae bacterium]
MNYLKKIKSGWGTGNKSVEDTSVDRATGDRLVATNSINFDAADGVSIPFDLATALSTKDWREHLEWPVTPTESAEIPMSATKRYLAMLKAISDPFQRRLAIATLPGIFPRALAIVEAAFAVQRAHEAGRRMIGGPEELDALRGQWGTNEIGELTIPKTPYSPGHNNQLAPPRLAWLRHLKIAAPWNGWQFPAALISPTATALSSSALLDRAVHLPGERVLFRYPKTLLDDAMRGATTAPIQDDVRELEERYVVALSSEPALSDEMQAIVAALIRRIVTVTLEPAGQHLKAFECARNLPKRIWSGSAGIYLQRIIGLEIMRRGGDVVRFAHGGCYGHLFANPHEAAVGELAASTHFVAPSGNMATVMENSGALDLIAEVNRPKILALDGDAQLAQSLAMKRRSSPSRPRVLYVMTKMMGFMQYATPCNPADVVFLDWQYRLVEYLKTLPIDLLCQPHPGGPIPSGMHPVTKSAPTNDTRFEGIMDWPDVFLYDIVGSTTFIKATATDRKVVLANLLPKLLSDHFMETVRRRCTLVDVEYDERNLPNFDKAQLADALCDLEQIGDPTEIRELFLEGSPKW